MPRKKPRKITVFDFETDPFDGTTNIHPFVAGYYDGEEFIYFWGDDAAFQLADHLCDRHEICYAHNGGKFDFYYLFPWLNKEIISVVNGRISQASIGKCLLRDSFMLYPLALASYKKDEIEYWKMKPQYREEYKDEILSYLKTDCIALFEIVTDFVERFGRKITMASAAMNELKKFLPGKMQRFNISQDEKFRRYYYGGRCEAFKRGEFKGRYKIYDINSAYPRAMMEQHPDPCNPSFTCVDYLPNDGVYFASIKAISRGALPYRYINDEDNPELMAEMVDKNIPDKKLLFPNDNAIRTYHVTGWEIRAGLETGTLDIKEIIEVHIPNSTISFAEFISKYWGLRALAQKQKDLLFELFMKLVMNSSYGKFAMNPLDYKEYKITSIGANPNGDADDIAEKGYWQLESSWPTFGLDIWKRDDPDYAGFYNVAVASSITGWVRAYLWRHICQCEGVLYCDTDSITCRKFQGELGNGLGQWKHEYNVSPCYIAGKKLYAFYYGNKKGQEIFDDVDEKKKYKWKLASKGVRLRPRDIFEISTGDTVVVWFSEAPVFSLKFGQRTLQREVTQTF